MPDFKVPKTREAIIKMIVEMEGQRAKWHEEKAKAKPKEEAKPVKPEKAKKEKKPKGEPGEASKTLKKVSALKGAKQNAQDAV